MLFLAVWTEDRLRIPGTPKTGWR